MKNKLGIWIVSAVYAIPIPISLITILGSIISIANIGATANESVVLAIVSVVSMVLAGTYSITYVITTAFTFRKKRLSFINLFPLFHIILAVVSCAVWSNL